MKKIEKIERPVITNGKEGLIIPEEKMSPLSLFLLELTDKINEIIDHLNK